MLAKKADAKQVSNSDKCTVWEYNTQTENFNIASAFNLEQHVIVD